MIGGGGYGRFVVYKLPEHVFLVGDCRSHVVEVAVQLRHDCGLCVMGDGDGDDVVGVAEVVAAFSRGALFSFQRSVGVKECRLSVCPHFGSVVELVSFGTFGRKQDA